MAQDAERSHAEKLLDAYRKRLEKRELQKAELGISADPSIDTEIDSLNTEIDNLRASIAELEQHQPLPRVISAARKATRNQYDSDIEFLIADGAGRNRRQTKIEEVQAAQGTEIHEVKKVVLNLVEDFAQDKQAAEHGRRRNFVLQLDNVTLLIVGVGIIIALALQVFGP